MTHVVDRALKAKRTIVSVFGVIVLVVCTSSRCLLLLLLQFYFFLSSTQWGAADAEITVPSSENTEL